MGWFQKKPDPISERERALNAEIAALEAQIKELDAQFTATPVPSPPRLRSTAMPHGAATVVHQSSQPGPSVAAEVPPQEPIFETVGQDRLKGKTDAEAAPEHFNELGVRKYDLAAVLRRAKNHLRGPPTANPRLVNYLAAGSIHGLRPMRYEKRVARNRFLASVIVLLVVLIGILAYIRLRR